jgi:hypothetical protein
MPNLALQRDAPQPCDLDPMVDAISKDKETVEFAGAYMKITLATCLASHAMWLLSRRSVDIIFLFWGMYSIDYFRDGVLESTSSVIMLLYDS